jgi:hypothetical protein
VPITAAAFRRLALTFPETAEGAHMGHPDFRVRGKIFATLAWPDKGWGMVKLTPDQQRGCVHHAPAVFAPVTGAWGRRGSTSVRLAAATKTTVRMAMLAAWCSAAPERLVRQFTATRSGRSRLVG